MAYPPITPLPTPPSRSQSPATFSNDADAFLGSLPDFGESMNELGQYLEAAAENATAGAANFVGTYNAGTTYQIGQSVLYNGFFWLALTVNTGVTPIEGANWRNVTIIDGGTF